MFETEPSSRVVKSWMRKAGRRHSVWLIFASSWPNAAAYGWASLYRNTVHLVGWGRGVGVNRKVDMTLGDSRLQLHGLSNTNEGGFLCFWALLQRSSHQNGSDHGREIHVSFGGGWSRSSDTLTWLRPPFLSLHYTGLAPDFLNMATTKATVPQKEPFSQWFKFLVFCPSRDNERGLTSCSCQEGLEFSGKRRETTS